MEERTTVLAPDDCRHAIHGCLVRGGFRRDNYRNVCARLIFLYRNEVLMLHDVDMELRKGDEVAIIAHCKAVPELKARWACSG